MPHLAEHGAVPVGEVSVGGTVPLLKIWDKKPLDRAQFNYHILKEWQVWMGNHAFLISAGTLMGDPKRSRDRVLKNSPYNSDSYGFSEKVQLPDGREQLLYVVTDGGDSNPTVTGVQQSEMVASPIESPEPQGIIGWYKLISQSAGWIGKPTAEILDTALQMTNLGLYTKNHSRRESGKKHTGIAVTVLVIEEEKGELQAVIGIAGKGKAVITKERQLVDPLKLPEYISENTATGELQYPNLGEYELVTPRIISIDLQPENMVTLITDGISTEESAVKAALTNKQPQEAVVNLLKTVSTRPQDDATALIIRVLSQQEAKTNVSVFENSTLPAQAPDENQTILEILGEKTRQEYADTVSSDLPNASHKTALSRRKLVTSLVGLGLAATGADIVWRLVSQRNPPANTKEQINKLPLGKTVEVYRGHNGKVLSVAWSPDGKYVASGAYSGTAQVWDPKTGILISEYSGGYGVPFVAWSPHSKYILSASDDNYVEVWEANSGKLKYEFLTPGGLMNTIECLAWSPDGKYFVAGNTGGIAQVRDANTGNLVLEYKGHVGKDNEIFNVYWSPDSKYVASAAGGTNNSVQIWYASDGSLKLEIQVSGKYSNTVGTQCASWSPDGKYFVMGKNDGTAQVRDANTGNLVLEYKGHSKAIRTIVWSPDGKYIASGSWDKTAQVWNAATGKQVIEYTKHTGDVLALAWSPDSKYIASGSSDQTVQEWVAE